MIKIEKYLFLLSTGILTDGSPEVSVGLSAYEPPLEPVALGEP
jgi:hypothetical protein